MVAEAARASSGGEELGRDACENRRSAARNLLIDPPILHVKQRSLGRGGTLAVAGAKGACAERQGRRDPQ